MISISFERVYNFVERRNGQIVAVFVALTILGGLVYALYLGPQLRYLPDERDYVTIATHLAQRGIYSLDGSTPTAFRAPGYPLVLAGLRLFNAGVVALRSLNYVFLGISIYVLYRILRQQASPLAATLGAGWVLAYPVLFYTAGTLYPQTLASLLFLLALYSLTKPRRTPLDLATGGLLLGYLTLTVPTFILATAIIAAWLLVDAKAKIAKIAGSALLVLVPLSLVLGAWTARNYVAFQAFVFVSTNSGENLLVGNSENSVPNAGRRVDISRYERQAASLDELARDRYFRAAALDYMRTHKAHVVKLYFLKALNYFNFRNELVTAEEGSWLRDLVMLLTYAPLLILFVLRLVSLRRFPPTNFEILVIVLYVANAFFSAIFFTRIRFRLPFDYLLIINAALMIDHFIADRKKIPAGEDDLTRQASLSSG